MNFSIYTVFLKNRNIIFKMKISKVTDYAALKLHSLNFWSFNFRTNVSIFQEHSKKLKFRCTFYQFRKSKQIISIKTASFMLKLTAYNYWRDANNYQQEKNTPILWDNSLFRAIFGYCEQIYCENLT